MMDKKIVEDNFSRCAQVYDRYCEVQRKAGSELIREIDGGSCSQILEIGCGTGNFTLLLREKFKTARITAVDISKKMIEIAWGKCKDKNVVFSVADGEYLALSEKFGLITANASLQWFSDLDRAMQNYHHALKEGGAILFSLFGPMTFRELRRVLADLFGREIVLASDSFLPREELQRLLEKYFPAPGIKEEIFEQNYSSLLQLLRQIKFTGERGAGISNQAFPGRKLLSEGERLYRSLFGGIRVTYQVFFVKGVKS